MNCYGDYLEHHGIKGQRWGVRRFQNPDGTLTEAGRKRYNYLDSNGKLDKYKKLGLSKEEQIKARLNKEKALKTAAVVGGVVLTGAAIYAGRRYMARNFDTVIKSGTSLQTIMAEDKIDTGRQFYTAINKLDKVRYGAISIQQNGSSNIHKLVVGKDFKIASDKSAEKVFRDLMKNDSGFSKEVTDSIRSILPYARFDQYHGKSIKNAVKGLDKNKINTDMYDIFNVQLADGGFNNSVKDKFYAQLKKSGYAGLKDVNDVKFTNYRSVNPIIMFDGSDKFSKIEVNKLSKKHANAGKAAVYGQAYGKLLSKPIAGIVGYKTAKKVYRSNVDPEIVAEYRQLHPNTKKSYDEILKLYYE